jgi:hypothetical protein
MNQFPIHWQGDNLVMIIGSDTVIANKNTHPRFGELVDAIKNRDWDLAAHVAVNKVEPISFKDGHIEVKDNVAYYAGRLLPEGISKMLHRLLSEGFPHEYFVKFINNLMNNSSHRSVTQLYEFLTMNDMPITEDGCFMAYKAVEDGYMSKHSDRETGERVRYMVGDVPTMPRFLISDDPDMLCHAGLHACSMKYLESWSGKHLMLVKINPADVVCVPYDCNRTKMRVCRMEVVSEVLNDKGESWYTGRNGTGDRQYDVLSRQQKQHDEGYIDDVRSGLNGDCGYTGCGFCDCGYDDDDNDDGDVYCLECGNYDCTCDDHSGSSVYNRDDDEGDYFTRNIGEWDGCDD